MTETASPDPHHEHVSSAGTGEGGGRRVTFGSRRSRARTCIIGLALLAVAYFVVRPTLRGDSAPPAPWTIAVGDHQLEAKGRAELHVWMRTGKSCGNPVHVTGLLGEELERGQVLRDVILSVDGTKIANVHFYEGLRNADPAIASDHERRAAEIGFSRAARDGIPTWRPKTRLRPLLAVAFAFDADVAGSDGFQSCWVSAPQVLPRGAGQDDEAYAPHRLSPFDQLLGGADSYTFSDLKFADLNVLASGWLPDSSSMGSGAVVGPSLERATALSDGAGGPAIRSTCVAPHASQAARSEAVSSACQASYRFTRAGSSAKASRLTLLAGLIFSAGLTLILEAFLSGGRSHGVESPADGAESSPT
jgi:hypothetical protein